MLTEAESGRDRLTELSLVRSGLNWKIDFSAAEVSNLSLEYRELMVE